MTPDRKATTSCSSPITAWTCALSLVCACSAICACSADPAGSADDAGVTDQLVADGIAEIDGDSPDTGLPVACHDDHLSPNQTQSEAHRLDAAGWIEDLVVCRGSDDWYVVDLPYGHTLQFDACRDSDGPAVDFEFFREEFPQPQYHMGGGHSSSLEVCDGTAWWQGEGRYFFRVSTQQEEARYAVHLLLEPWKPLPCPVNTCSGFESCVGGVCTCDSDALEPNDSPSEARELTFDQPYQLIGCIEDSDWFKVWADAGESLKIQLETAVVLGQGYFLELSVYSQSDTDNPLALYPKGLWSEAFTFAAPQAGTYLLRVRPVQIAPRDYTIKVSKT